MAPFCFIINRQRILVVGGGGAVGFAAIQLAVAAGCHVATTCGKESVDRMIKAGAEQAVDYVAEVVVNLYYILFLAISSDTLILTQPILLNFFFHKKREN